MLLSLTDAVVMTDKWRPKNVKRRYLVEKTPFLRYFGVFVNDVKIYFAIPPVRVFVVFFHRE